MHRSRYEKYYKEETLPTSLQSSNSQQTFRGSKWNFCFLFVAMILLCLGMGQMFLFYHVNSSSSEEIQRKLDECTSLLTSYAKISPETSSYDLRDVLLLPPSASHDMTLQAFQSKWQLKSQLYVSCGVTVNRAPPSHVPPLCDYVIISSWAPRPCGIATHSGMLYEALRRVCPEKSRIDVIAVTKTNQPIVHPIIKTIAQDNIDDYSDAAAYITQKKYGTVLFAYEFGLYADEAVLCLLRHISGARVVTMLHTVADNLPLQKQALTEQV